MMRARRFCGVAEFFGPTMPGLGDDSFFFLGSEEGGRKVSEPSGSSDGLMDGGDLAESPSCFLRGGLSGHLKLNELNLFFIQPTSAKNEEQEIGACLINP